MNNNIHLLNLHTISLNAIFCISVLIPFYRDEIDLTFQDFLIGECVFAALLLFLEVPSGWLSDIWKRKYVLALSGVAWTAGFTILLNADNLTETILAQATLAICVSLFSGTNSAMLYDTLLVQQREDLYSKLEERRNALGLYTVAISSVIGGFMYEIDPQLPLLASLLGGVAACVCALMMDEPVRHKSAIQYHPLKDMVITVRYALRGYAEIGFIILFAGCLFAATKLIMWSQQPYFMALSWQEKYFGILMAVGFILGGLSNQLAHRLDGRISNLKALSLSLISALVICFLAGLFIAPIGAALLMIGGTCLYGLAAPRVNDAINKRVESDRRATILSTLNLLAQLFFIPLSLCVGWMSDHMGIRYMLWTVSGWLCFAGIFLALWYIKRRKK